MNHPPTILLLAGPLAAEGCSEPVPAGLDALLTQAMASNLPVRMVAPPDLASWARQRLPGSQVIVPPEPMPESRRWLGQAIRAGVQSSANAQGWLLLPAELPSTQARTLLTLAHSLARYAVVYPQYGQTQGHPIGFSSEMYSELVRLEHDHDLVRLAARYPATAISTDDPGIVMPASVPHGLQRWHSPQPSARRVSAHALS
ncbi:NTP transferase domain-containing protein [Aquabacterium sp.]|uniref:NTP transferase domain-containing protein n=1 Tax=Aquabacterium sp. TaxID=1872578 RepID=UPI0025C18FB1|nr:NTP transferase domain-containing protein [Aquabacterium sp.]